MANNFVLPPDLAAIDGIVFKPFDDQKHLKSIVSHIERELSEPYSIFTYRYFIHGWPELCILAFDQRDLERVVGVVVCKLDRANRRRRLRGYVAMLAVDPEYRGRRIGSALVARAVEEMRRQKADEVVLEAEYVNQGAMRLYSKLGFVRDKRLSRYYLNGSDAFRLKLWLTSFDDDSTTQGSENEVEEEANVNK